MGQFFEQVQAVEQDLRSLLEDIAGGPWGSTGDAELGIQNAVEKLSAALAAADQPEEEQGLKCRACGYRGSGFRCPRCDSPSVTSSGARGGEERRGE